MNASLQQDHTAHLESTDLALALRECEPWCEDGDGHPDEHPADRWCRSKDHIVPLSLGEPYQSDGAWWIDHLRVSMDRMPGEDFDRVTLVHEVKAPGGIELTRGEARQLVEALADLERQAASA